MSINRVFLSAASNEFGSARDELANVLQSRDITVRVQRSFYNDGRAGTLLRQLKTYIESCDLVVCLIGKRSGGGFPQPGEAAEYSDYLPRGIGEASYTQWEFIFARRFRRPCLVYIATEKFLPDEIAAPKDDRPDLQAAFVDYVKSTGVIWDPVDDINHFIRKAQNSIIPPRLDGEPTARPLASFTGVVPDSWSLTGKFEAFLQPREKIFGRQWLIDAINDWSRRDTHQQILLITGPPGAGKSSIIAHIAGGTSPCGLVVAYHCCLSADADTRDLLTFFCNLAFMLARALPSYAEILLELYSNQPVVLIDPEANAATVSDNFFKKIFIIPFAKLGRPKEIGDGVAWILVDALDEATAVDAADDSQSIIEFILKFLPSLPGWLRLLATSRPAPVPEKFRQHDVGRLMYERRIGDGVHGEDDRACVIGKLEAAGRELPDRDTALICARANGNMLLLGFLVDGFLAGIYKAGGVNPVPGSLPTYYSEEFRRAYPDHTDEGFRGLVLPMLKILTAQRARLPIECLASAIGVPADRVHALLRTRFSNYLSVSETEGVERFHKSFTDWLTNPLLAKQYSVAEKDGHTLLADWCWREYEKRHGRAVELRQVARTETGSYMVHHGVEHLIAAGKLAGAVAVLRFIHDCWQRDRTSAQNVGSISIVRWTRAVLDAISDAETDATATTAAPTIEPKDLIPLVKNFYQVEPLFAPLKLLLRQHSDRFEVILEDLLQAGNYVLRYAAADAVGALCAEDPPAIPIDRVVREYFESRDEDRRELGSYALRRLYVMEPDRIVLAHLEALGDSETYPLRIALGDLLLNLTLQGRSWVKQVKSVRFWQPVWPYNWLDVWMLKAADAFFATSLPAEHEDFVAGPLPADADAGTKTAYGHLQHTEMMRQALLAEPDVRSSAALLNVVEGYYTLGTDIEALNDAQSVFGKSPLLLRLVRLLFAHPLWEVGEAAASMLCRIVDETGAESGTHAIIGTVLDDPYWRIRYSAIEAAYQRVAVEPALFLGTKSQSFQDGAVMRFYDDANARVRALCAENLIADIVERPRYLRDRYLLDFKKPLQRWMNDNDAWVLEHVFRLLSRLDRDGYDCGEFFADGVPDLLAGLPGAEGSRGWSKVPRATFLHHVEARRRASLNRPDPNASS